MTLMLCNLFCIILKSIMNVYRTCCMVFHFIFSPIFFPVLPDLTWSIEKQHETGTLFLRRDSSRVKFRCEVEVLEFVRDPEELKFMMAREYVEDASHPLVVIATCIFAIAITVVLPWMLMGSNSIQ